jgi:DUF1680 family protein
MTISRRNLLRNSAALATARFAATPFVRALQTASSNGTPQPLQQLAYSQVQLLDSPLRTQFDQNVVLFMGLDDDRLLKPFRQLTGMPAPGEDMGGWYTPSPLFDPPKNMTGYVPGHTFGQYLSGLARAYAQTGDKRTQAKVHGLVRGFAATVSTKFYDGYCLPCYTFDKTMCGLIDAHQFAQDPIAFNVLDRATDAVLPWLPDHALTRAEMRARPHPNEAYTWDEPYTLPENFYLAYARGAGLRYRLLAQRYLQDATYFTPLAEGRNVLPGEHAYSHVNALNSAMQAWFVDSSKQHFDAARNGFRFVQQQSFATGGWGPNEGFQKPDSDDLANSLTHTHNSFETPCGAYGHFKITRNLLCATGDSMYGDSMETVLYNTILGARPIRPDGVSFYYADYNSDAHKSDYEQKWPCCSGTFPQLTADYGISSYFRTSRGLAVNLYTPSRVSWQQGSARLTLTQRHSYPVNGEIALMLTSDRRFSFPLTLRIPDWAGPATRIAINGKPWTSSPIQPGLWLTINREWRNHDQIELSLDMPLRLIPLDATHPDLVALAHGPVVLFVLLPAPERLEKSQLLSARRSSNTSDQWQISTSTGPVTLLPYTAITNEHYRLYHQTA